VSASPPVVAPVRFEVDRRDERQLAWLRLGAALLLLVCGLWLLWLPFTLPRLVGLAGLIFALRFAKLGFAGLRAGDGTLSTHYLALDRDGLRLAEGGPPRFVPWSDLQAIETDEDRLVLRLHEKGGDVIEVEPRYPDVGLEQLREAIAGRWRAVTET